MSHLILFLMCLLLWMLLVWPFHGGAAQVLGALCAWPAHSGAWEKLLAASFTQDFVAGVLVALMATALFGRRFPLHPGRLLHPLRYLWMLLYLPAFTWACLAANLDVAYRVLHLRLPIRPAIVKVRTSLKSDMGKFILANSITLTPGTLSVDIVGQDLYVHWINARDGSPQERTEMLLGRLEGILKKVFE